ncbi:heterokaryon incompatibility protein-domain-containing protein [Lophiotrema nucula]|uniref:Heterokaryon incompatibility protein-domain-containing protein n=1 Tax=Lophiotrema nucula TaxID=690887 RepID=A0A6A5ZUU6_9PLEO|nr:heterokaryon incompatibility protein-domain-containing protein [Lophiotrema nucula]
MALPDIWPKRLLHTQSMTSVERHGLNTYRGIKAPDYNAISYTWGRYFDEGITPIEIYGITWKVPGIHPSHFTTKEFKSAIEKASSEVAFLWLDIACIDQENEKIKLEEINNQPAIFKRASFVYAWMTPWDTPQMIGSLQVLEADDLKLDVGLSRYRLIPTGTELTSSTENVLKALTDICEQPWFTSLWTLQEAYLAEPYILSRSAELLEYSLYVDDEDQQIHRPVHLSWLNVVCWKLWTRLNRDTNITARKICSRIADSGFLALSNRNFAVLYGASTKRKASFEHDAIYGIMQVYGIRLAAQPDLNRLSMSFNLHLITTHSVGGQLFLHEEPVDLQEAWQLSRKIFIPNLFQFPGSFSDECAMTQSYRQRPLFDGQSCSLQDLLTTWALVMEAQQKRNASLYQPRLFLDATKEASCRSICLVSDSATSSANEDLFMDTISTVADMRSLPNIMGIPVADCRVLYLGLIRSALHSWHDPHRPGWTATIKIGMLVIQPSGNRTSQWCRIGFCAWFDAAESLSSVWIESERDAYEIEEKNPVPIGTWSGFTCRL